ncbi:MAG: phosphoribosylglycinamide formyltransferase 2 [Candidatus Nezhaarchaeota archaeon]|nr:phosphoribosylglycinamide formyltransferase 2 [Candidatus Nezhaarchaeota archaeon]
MRIQPRDVVGTPLFEGSVKLMLLGCGELGKEIAIEASRMGVEVVAVDRYQYAPAMQVAHRSYVVNMLDGGALKAIARRERPDVIVPEIEAINTDALIELEEEGFFVVPNARAVKTTMDRVLLRKLAAEEAGVPTSRYEFATNVDELRDACEKVGYPCIVKAQMSSGGLGSSVVFGAKDVEKAYWEAQTKARGRGGTMIVEGLVTFDLEVTELAVAHLGEDGRVKISFPKPVGHVRSGSHFHTSWQPFVDIEGEESKSVFEGFGSPRHLEEDPPKSPLLWSSKWNGRRLPRELVEKVEAKIYEAAGKVVSRLIKDGGLGLFGCELFVKLGGGGEGPEVLFNEVSPRPHDTGMVTMVTQDLSEMALHVRAVLGLPIPEIRLRSVGAAHVVLAHREGSWAPRYAGIWRALAEPGVHLRLFGKPATYVERRMGLALATAPSIAEAREKAMKAAHTIEASIQY